jgi:hypothetical protein
MMGAGDGRQSSEKLAFLTSNSLSLVFLFFLKKEKKSHHGYNRETNGTFDGGGNRCSDPKSDASSET